MATIFEIPLSASPQSFKITLAGTDYRLTMTYKNTTEGGWVLDIADSNNVPLVSGIALVTGIDLLAQYPDLNIGGGLWVQTGSNPDAVPTFDNLGSDGHLYFVTT